jgi:hypothetical protein
MLDVPSVGRGMEYHICVLGRPGDGKTLSKPETLFLQRCETLFYDMIRHIPSWFHGLGGAVLSGGSQGLCSLSRGSDALGMKYFGAQFGLTLTSTCLG